MGGGGSKPAEDDRRRHRRERSPRTRGDRPSSHGGSSSSHLRPHGGRRDHQYGSLAGEHAPFLWESNVTPWRLFLLSVVSMLQNIAGLMMLYWVGVSQKQYLMKCDLRDHTMHIVLACEYTKAYVRAFPLLASSIVILVAMRLVLQQRVYYGLLRIGGLLDFQNVAAYRDPVVWLLSLSMVHGFGHFALKVCYGTIDSNKELVTIFQKFIVPTFIAMAFFYASYDVEKTLIPLSKYFEEDTEYARRTLGHMYHLKEDIVHEEIVSTDMVLHAQHPHIKDVYKVMITRYHRVAAGFDDKNTRVCGCEFRLFHSMWPAKILLDGRLTDNDSISFRRMFMTFAFLAVVVQVLILAGFAYQVYKDIWIDVWTQGEYEDLGSFFVMLFHLCIIVWVLIVSLLSGFPGLFSCCGKRGKHHGSEHAHHHEHH